MKKTIALLTALIMFLLSGCASPQPLIQIAIATPSPAERTEADFQIDMNSKEFSRTIEMNGMNYILDGKRYEQDGKKYLELDLSYEYAFNIHTNIIELELDLQSCFEAFRDISLETWLATCFPESLIRSPQFSGNSTGAGQLTCPLTVELEEGLDSMIVRFPVYYARNWFETRTFCASEFTWRTTVAPDLVTGKDTNCLEVLMPLEGKDRYEFRDLPSLRRFPDLAMVCQASTGEEADGVEYAVYRFAMEEGFEMDEYWVLVFRKYERIDAPIIQINIK